MPSNIILAGPTKLTTTGLTTLYTTPNNGIKPAVTHMIITKLNTNAVTYSVFLNASFLDDSRALYWQIPTLARKYTLREVYQQPLGLAISGNTVSAQCSEANAITITLFGVING